MSDTVAKSVSLDYISEYDSSWHDAPRRWGHSLHKLSPYVGGFPPSLSHYFIRRYTDENDVVLDPFCGGGTTLLEAGLCGREVLGNDALSYAHVLSKAKCNPLPKWRFNSYLNEVIDEARAIPDESLQLDNEDIAVFYSESTLQDILAVRHVLHERDSKKATFLSALICGILHGPSDIFLSVQTKDTYSGTANYVEKYIDKNDLKKPDRDIERCAWEKYKLATRDGVPKFNSSITRGDARELSFEDESADFILTSPPYMHTLDYTWNNWIRLWWLGEDRKSERDGLDITADIEKYRAFLGECLSEMYRVLAPDSRAVIVVGDVKKRRASGTEVVNTGNLVAQEAKQTAGFEVEEVILDDYDIDKRSYVRFNEMKYNAGEEEEEPTELLDRCIVLKKGSPTPRPPIDVDWGQTDTQ